VRRELYAGSTPPLYNECITLRMVGPLDAATLKRSFLEIIRRHEIWRTSYACRNGGLVQVVHPVPDELWGSVLDLQGLSPSAREEKLREVIGEEVRRPFDLERGPLMRTRLVKLADHEHRLFVVAHLSIIDGISAYQILPFELSSFYRAFSEGHPSPLSDPAIQFGDYADWQRRWMGLEALPEQVEYWRKQLMDFPEVSWPPYSGVMKRSYSGTIRPFSLAGNLSHSIKLLCQREGATTFAILLATLVTLLHFYTQRTDIIVGTPSPAGRKRSEVEKLLGYFLNPLSLRFDLDGDPGFCDLLRQAHKLTLEALSNDDVPIEILGEEFNTRPYLGRNPFFTAAISLQPPAPQLTTDWSVTSMDFDSGGSPWDLYLAFIDHPNGFKGRIQYNPDLFDSTRIDRILLDVEDVLKRISMNPSGRISEMSFKAAQV